MSRAFSRRGVFVAVVAAMGAAPLVAQPPEEREPPSTVEERLEAEAERAFADPNVARQVAKIMVGTLVSEDLTCITVGLLIRKSILDPRVGIGGCFLGILLGDAALWLLGRLVGYRALRWRRVTRWIPPHRVEYLERWFERRGWSAVLAARFLPGTRMPVYFMAGAVGHHAAQFLVCALIAALFWTPLLILLVVFLGHRIAGPLEAVFGAGILSLLISALCILLLLRVLSMSATAAGRAKMIATVSRLWRWEFWPPWLFYLPLVPWIGWLAMRYRGLTVPTACNPGIPHGGVIGESKYAILRQLPADCIVASGLIPPGVIADRVEQLSGMMKARSWSFPLILKPDVGQRGLGLRRIHGLEEAHVYFQNYPAAVLVQTYHPGPFEAGIFYVRMPDEPTGRIFSITDKHFPVVHGDGSSSVEELIWRDPRLRMQAKTFFARLGAGVDRVPARGERVGLAVAGNHCQGTLFRDGAHRITPQLEQRIDAIARAFPGFFFGRFDIRYADPDALARGEASGIVELNGLLSESTNVYDPSWRLARAYRVLFRQWTLAFAVGDANRRLGHRPSTPRELYRAFRAYYRAPRPAALSD